MWKLKDNWEAVWVKEERNYHQSEKKYWYAKKKINVKGEWQFIKRNVLFNTIWNNSIIEILKKWLLCNLYHGLFCPKWCKTLLQRIHFLSR